MKILDLIFVVLGIIALLGSVVAGYALTQVGSALSTLSSSNEQVAGVQEAVSLYDTLLLVGWIWIIAVILASVYTIRTGIQRVRNKIK